MAYLVRLDRPVRLKVESLNFPILLRFTRITRRLAVDPRPSPDVPEIRREVAYGDAYSWRDATFPMLILYRVFTSDVDPRAGLVWVYELRERGSGT